MGLDGVEIVMECEESFKIVISDQESLACYRVGELQDLCVRLIAEQVTGRALTAEREEEVRLHVREMIAEQMSIPLDSVQPESRFIQDLGFD